PSKALYLMGSYGSRSHARSNSRRPAVVNTVDANVYNAIFVNDPTPQYDARDAYYERVAQGTEHSTPFYTSREVDQISDPTIRELATAWVKPPKLSPEVIAFFDHF